MKKILAFIFLLVITCCHAQYAYKVTYGILYPGNGIITEKDYTRINKKIAVFNDSTLYIYHVAPLQKDPLEQSEVYGEKFLHHAQLSYLNSLEYFHYMLSLKNSRKNYLLHGRVAAYDKWIIDSNEHHYFQQYRCFNAYAVSGTGDTTHVVYTPDIPVSFRAGNLCRPSGTGA